MATRDQALFLETFLGLQRAIKRKSYDSDSDSDIDHSTNRGNKLKRRARFVRAGQLGAADGLSVFAEPIEHAGYVRKIISHNPPLVDEDGYEVDTDDDDEAAVQEAEAAAAAAPEDANPYAGIRLEHLLAPLTAVTDLPNHPTLARPFTSKALTELATQGCSWMHKENAALWEVKPLLTKLCGDHIWVDCALLVTPDDARLFDDDMVARLTRPRPAKAKKAAAIGPPNGDADMPDAGGGGEEKEEKEKEEEEEKEGKEEEEEKRSGATDRPLGEEEGGEANGAPNGEADAGDADMVVEEEGGGGDGDDDNHDDNRDDSDSDSDSDSDGEGFIHPLFLAPAAARPEANLGLPEAEAEDVRRLLQLWVQKQEEVARGTRKLHEGLLRADRLRKTVLRWAKAEAHSGALRDLSDGEDWYDRDEWGLVEDLKKGHDEEEEDLQQPHKKTRNRK